MGASEHLRVVDSSPSIWFKRKAARGGRHGFAVSTFADQFSLARMTTACVQDGRQDGGGALDETNRVRTERRERCRRWFGAKLPFGRRAETSSQPTPFHVSAITMLVEDNPFSFGDTVSDKVLTWS